MKQSFLQRQRQRWSLGSGVVWLGQGGTCAAANADDLGSPGESAIFVDSLSREAFIAWWGPNNLPPALKVITYSGYSLSPWSALPFQPPVRRFALPDAKGLEALRAALDNDVRRFEGLEPKPSPH